MCFFLWNLSNMDTSIKIGMNSGGGATPWALLFLKKPLANKKVKMTAICRDGRHFDYENRRL